MPDLKTIEGKVLVDADRYEELIKLEARVESLATFLKAEQYATVDTVLLLLGFQLGFHVPQRKEKSYEEVMELDS